MTTDPNKRDVALVVDDSPETLRLLTDALDGAGMTVMVAMDGAAAIRIVDQITPDIVLLDAVMPGMTASISTMSGVIWSTIRIAEAPSSATMTVMPAPSSASVNSRSVSGESSTTRATSRFLGSVIIAVQGFQCGHVLVEVEAIDQ